MRLNPVASIESHVILTNYYSVFYNKIIIKFLKGFILKTNSLYLIINSSLLQHCLMFLKFNSVSSINTLVDIVAVDYPTRLENRFELIYAFWNTKYNFRVYIKTYTNSTTPILSISSFFNSLLDWNVKSEICMV